jgi:hypothetical protein
VRNNRTIFRASIITTALRDPNPKAIPAMAFMPTMATAQQMGKPPQFEGNPTHGHRNCLKDRGLYRSCYTAPEIRALA